MGVGGVPGSWMHGMAGRMVASSRSRWHACDRCLILVTTQLHIFLHNWSSVHSLIRPIGSGRRWASAACWWQFRLRTWSTKTNFYLRSSPTARSRWVAFQTPMSNEDFLLRTAENGPFEFTAFAALTSLKNPCNIASKKVLPSQTALTLPKKSSWRVAGSFVVSRNFNKKWLSVCCVTHYDLMFTRCCSRTFLKN